MFDRVFAAFPKRPMRVKKHGVAHPFIAFLGIPIGFLIFWMVADSMLPGILRDWEISKDPIGAPNVSVHNGKCSTRAILVSCDVTLGYSVKINPATEKDPLAKFRGTRGAQQKLSFSFFDIHFGDYRARAITARSDQSLMSVDLAVDKLWNRIAFMLFMAGFGIFFVVGSLVLMARQMTRRRVFRGFNGKILRPVAVEITKLVKNAVEYTYEAKGKKRKLNVYLVKNKPFFLDNNDTKMALGVVDEHDDYPLLVDEKLTRLDFTDAERQALWNARNADTVKSRPEAAFPSSAVGIEPAR